MVAYRVVERCYGPKVRFRDWEADGGKAVAAGGTLQIFAGESALVTRADYPYGGGGDVEVTLAFNFEHLGEAGCCTVHFNRRGGDASGFRVVMDRAGTTVYRQDEALVRGGAVDADPRAVHTLRLVTLAESFALYLDGRPLAAGEMAPPFLENEGKMAFLVRDAGLRVITFEEAFIVHDVAFPAWTRAELLYEEAFGEESWRRNWRHNGADPEILPDAFHFRHESVGMLAERFDGPLAVECLATPMPVPDLAQLTAGVSDAIFLWMITHPDGDLFDYLRGLPDASLKQYLPLSFYWVDFGGTNNVTTRLRKNPQRQMIRQFTDRARLLDRDRDYRVTCAQIGHAVAFHVDGQRWIAAHDPRPLVAGHIGFRAFVAGLTVRELKVWRITA